jgi:glycosyltransferase involved in cell wall biosynthesis
VKNITLISRHQFGYHTDFFYYAKYLSRLYSVRVVCLDSNLPKLEISNVETVYIGEAARGRLLRYLLLAMALWREARKPGHLMLVKYFLGVSLPLALSSKRNIIVDLRSLSVNRKTTIRFFEDGITKLEMRLFPKITVVSRALAKKISRENSRVVGLGGEAPKLGLGLRQRKLSEINLVYVGSVEGRDLDFVVRAISGSTRRESIFLKIIGNYDSEEGRKLVDLVTKLGLKDNVHFEGYLKGDLLEKAFRGANLGLVHVPPKMFYSCQPSTKLYEYWAYGLPVLVSDYGFDEQEIPPKSGYVYNYKVEALQELFETILDTNNTFDHDLILSLAGKHSWANVVTTQLIPALQNLHD